MKHIPLMKRGTSNSPVVSSFGRQLLVDDDDYYDENDVINFTDTNDHLQAVEENDGEGTECVIDTRSGHKTHFDTTNKGISIHTTTTNIYDDDEYHPPMCGQLFISKVIGQSGGSGTSRKQQSKTKELKSQRRSYTRRSPMLRLSKGENKNQLGKKRSMTVSGSGGGGGGVYHESFSAEQSPDSDSESSSLQSYNDRIRILSETTTTPTGQSTSPVVSHRPSANDQNSSCNRSSGGDSDTSSLPSHIVQFDPNELELIKTEKITFDNRSADQNSMTTSTMESPKPANNDVANTGPAKVAVKSLEKPSPNIVTKVNKKKRAPRSSSTVTAESSSFAFSSPSLLSLTATALLPTVAEEKSFDLIESPSTTSVRSNTQRPKNVSVTKIQETTLLLPTASSTSSSGDDDDEDDSAFFGCHASNHGNRANHADSEDVDDDEVRDDRETIAITQFGCFTPTSNQDETAFFSSESETSPNYNASNDRRKQPRLRNSVKSDGDDLKDSNPAQTDSPEMIEILNAMRQIIFKQQDAIQAISDENIDFRNQLAICHREMKTMQSESADQLVQITQLVIQKNSLDAETTQLKDEVAILRDEILRLKSDDADLVNRFESLMNNNDETTDDDTTVEKIDMICQPSTQQQYNSRNVSPLNDPIDHSSDNESWRQMLGPYDSASATNKSRNLTNRKNIMTYTKTSVTEDTVDSTIVDVNMSSSSNSASMTIETIIPMPETSNNTELGTSPTKCIMVPDRHASKDKDVAEFKTRLGEIQKKRMMRMGPNTTSTTSMETNSKDRKILTVRFL